MPIEDADLLRRIILWAQAQAVAGAATGSLLDEAGQALARKVGVVAPEQVRVVMVDQLPMPEDPVILQANRMEKLMDPRMDGLTLDHTLFLRQACICPSLMAHELRHVQQVEQAGSLGAFLVEYMRQIRAYQYENAPYERDARDGARRALQAP